MNDTHELTLIHNIATLTPFETDTLEGVWIDSQTYAIKSHSLEIGCFGFSDGYGGTPEVWQELKTKTNAEHFRLVALAWNIKKY